MGSVVGLQRTHAQTIAPNPARTTSVARIKPLAYRVKVEVADHHGRALLRLGQPAPSVAMRVHAPGSVKVAPAVGKVTWLAVAALQLWQWITPVCTFVGERDVHIPDEGRGVARGQPMPGNQGGQQWDALS